MSNTLGPEQRYELIAELRDQGIVDERVLEAIAAVPREAFIPPAEQSHAYDNTALPIGSGQTISQPYIVALMTQSLELTGQERVLEIGTGSGYQCAILSRLARQVFTVERIAELAWRARSVLEGLRFDNIRYRVGDGSLGWSSQAPFDRIIVTAAAAEIPPPLEEQLGEGGILVIPVGKPSEQVLESYRKVDGRLQSRFLCHCRFVQLISD